MPVQAWFAQDEISVRPGESVSLHLSIENLGDHTESYTVLPAGLSSAWTTVTRPNVTLFGGSRDVVEVVIRPPAIHTTSAGPATAAIRVIPQSDADETVIAETTLLVGSFDDRRIAVLQPLQRSRRRATYEFMVENHGNNLASCRLHLIDPSDRIDGTFDPPAVGVAPGSSSLVRLRARARHAYFRRGDRQIDFGIEATQPDHEPALGHATLVQPPTVPARFIWRVVAVAAVVAAFALAWNNVVKPEIQDAADRAVDDQLAENAVTAPSVPDAEPSEPAPTATTVAPSGGDDVGEPYFTRLALLVDVGLRNSTSYTVPGDQVFELTDLVLQNPNGDLGLAIVLRNSEPLYQWDLGAMSGSNEFQPRVTPIPFAPGDSIVLDVRCDGTGLPSSTACDVAVLVGGELAPAG